MKEECVWCRSTLSPPGARFCVACGHALRQPCPYGGCAQGTEEFQRDFDAAGLNVAPLGGATQPENRCTRCGHFLQICPRCMRLHRLDERICRTASCAQSADAPPLREVYAPCHGTLGDGGSASTDIPEAWQIVAGLDAEPLPGDWWCHDGADAPSPGGGIVGVDFRYGRLIGVREREAVVLPLLHSRQSLERRPSSRFQVLEAASWPRAGLFAAPHALLAAHGFAYLLGESQPRRMALLIGRESVAGAPIETLEFVPQPAQPAAQSVAPANSVSFDDFDWDNEPSGASGASASTWGSPEAIEWKLQAATRDFWMAMGASEKESRGVAVLSGGASGAFEGQEIAAPPLAPGLWRGLAACGDAFVLWGEREVWAWFCSPGSMHGSVGRAWLKIHQQADAGRIGGALACPRGLALWGTASEKLWVREVPLAADASSGSLTPGAAHWVAGVPAVAPGERLEVHPHPVLCGSRVFFFASNATQSWLCPFDLDNPAGRGASAEEPHALQPATRCVWAMGARPPLSTSGPEPFLAFALQRRDRAQDVTFFALRANQLAPPLRLASFEVRLDAPGSALAATIAEGRLVIAAQTAAQGLIGRAYDLSAG